MLEKEKPRIVTVIRQNGMFVEINDELIDTIEKKYLPNYTRNKQFLWEIIRVFENPEVQFGRPDKLLLEKVISLIAKELRAERAEEEKND